MATDIVIMLKDYFAGWNSHDVEKISSFFTDDCIYEDLATEVIRHGKKEVKALLNDLFVAIPDVKLDFTSIFGIGEWGAIEWIMSGTHASDSDIVKVQATGKSFSIRGASIMELSNGKISRNSDYWNFASFLKQIG